jgi:hypothetical protein
MKRLTIAVLCGFAMLALAPSAPAAIRITKIYFDSPGADTGSNFSLNAEWIRLRNTSARSRLLTGWKIRDAGPRLHLRHVQAGCWLGGDGAHGERFEYRASSLLAQ